MMRVPGRGDAGPREMWACMQEKDAIYANPRRPEDDYMRAAGARAGHFAEQ